MKNLLLFIFLIPLLPVDADAQEVYDIVKESGVNNSHLDVQTLISFEKEYEHKELKIEIDENLSKLLLEVEVGISHGTIKIEILDPNDNVLRHINLSANLNYKNVHTQGNLREKISKPILGDWKLKFIPNNATANISIMYKSIFVD